MPVNNKKGKIQMGGAGPGPDPPFGGPPIPIKLQFLPVCYSPDHSRAQGIQVDDRVPQDRRHIRLRTRWLRLERNDLRPFYTPG